MSWGMFKVYHYSCSIWPFLDFLFILWFLSWALVGHPKWSYIGILNESDFFNKIFAFGSLWHHYFSYCEVRLLSIPVKFNLPFEDLVYLMNLTHSLSIRLFLYVLLFSWMSNECIYYVFPFISSIHIWFVGFVSHYCL